MLGSMNRIFPGGRYYSPLVGGPLKYLAVLLVRLFVIVGSVFVPVLFILNAVTNYTDTSPDIFADVTVITVGAIVIGLWSLTIARDLLTRNRFGTSEPAQPGLWQLILNDLLLRGAHHGPSRSLWVELWYPFIIPLVWVVLSAIVGDSLAPGPVSIVLAVGFTAMQLYYLAYILPPRARSHSSKEVSVQNWYHRFYAGAHMPGISSLRIPRKFGLRGLPLRGRLALVGFRTLVLANTVFVSVVWGSMGFWGLEPGFSFGQAWPPPLEYWIVIAVAFGSVPLLLAYTLVRDLKARGVRTSSQRMKAVFLDELGVVPEYTLSPWTKRLAFLSFIGTIIGVVSGFTLPWVGMTLVTLTFGIPRLLFILWSRPYAPDNTEQTP